MVGAPKPIGGLAGDQGGTVGRLRLADRGRDRLLVVAVDPYRVPAMGLEARHLVDIVGQRDRAVDGDAVVVVEEDQLPQPQMPGERQRLVADAFHQVAVGAQHVGIVIDDVLAEFRREQPLGERAPDREGDALAERACRGLDTGGEMILRMARRSGTELAEVLDLIQRHVWIAGEIEQRVEQHRAVAGRKDETVAVRPFRIGRVEFEELREQHGGDVGGAHRQAGMPGFRLFDRIHRQRADRIGHTGMIDARHDENPPEMRRLVAIRRSGGWPGTSLAGQREPRAG